MERTSPLCQGLHKNPFTREQMEHLRENRYAKSVSASTIQFTEEFKRYFCQESTSGTPSRQIFLACGIDPDILGTRRIEDFLYTLHKQAKREESFTDKRQSNCRQESKPEEDTVETRLRQLEHELAYTRQEVEFLKKRKWQIWRRRNNRNPSTSRSKVPPHPEGHFAGQ